MSCDTFEQAAVSMKGHVELQLDKRRTWLARQHGDMTPRRAGIARSIALYQDLLSVIDRHAPSIAAPPKATALNCAERE